MDPEFENIVNRLDKDKKYLLYCAIGSRSYALADYMNKNGFSQIYNLVNA